MYGGDGVSFFQERQARSKGMSGWGLTQVSDIEVDQKVPVVGFEWAVAIENRQGLAIALIAICNPCRG